MTLSDKWYNRLKWLCLIALPALATCYGVIGKVWDLPYTGEIVTTITAIATMIGALIGISQINYKKDGGMDDGETV